MNNEKYIETMIKEFGPQLVEAALKAFSGETSLVDVIRDLPNPKSEGNEA